MNRTAQDGRELLRAAQQIHAERHGAQPFTPGTHLREVRRLPRDVPPPRAGHGAPRASRRSSLLRRRQDLQVLRPAFGGRGLVSPAVRIKFLAFVLLVCFAALIVLTVWIGSGQ
jgi:hypothetical protein